MRPAIGRAPRWRVGTRIGKTKQEKPNACLIDSTKADPPAISHPAHSASYHARWYAGNSIAEWFVRKYFERKRKIGGKAAPSIAPTSQAAGHRNASTAPFLIFCHRAFTVR